MSIVLRIHGESRNRDFGGIPSEPRRKKRRSGLRDRGLLESAFVAIALEQLEKLIDLAVLQNSPSIEIIHGIGTGAIREAVHNCLANYPHIASIRIDPLNAGTTWAYF